MARFPGNTDWVGQFIPDVDKQLGQFVVDNDEADAELVEIFIEELTRLTTELIDGLDQDSAEIVRESAHSIKGMGGTLGLPEISVVGLSIENYAKASTLSEARPLVAALKDWLLSVQ